MAGKSTVTERRPISQPCGARQTAATLHGAQGRRPHSPQRSTPGPHNSHPKAHPSGYWPTVPRAPHPPHGAKGPPTHPPAARTGTLPCEKPKCRAYPHCWHPSFSPHRRGPQEDMPQGESKFSVRTRSPKLVLRAPSPPHCLPPPTQKRKMVINLKRKKPVPKCMRPSAKGKTLPREQRAQPDLDPDSAWLGVLGQKPQASEKTQLPP